MAYSVNWLTQVVTIPKTDLTVVSASPEIYELDVLVFWATIHGIQDDFEAMGYPRIMRSNAPVTISGVTYVRSVEVINGYTIEFENGSYQVNLVGANNNILDVRVVNNVSINPSNSAGAIIVETTGGSGGDVNVISVGGDPVTSPDDFKADISALADAATLNAVLGILQLVKKYHDNRTTYLASDQVTETTQPLAHYMRIFDDDDATVLKEIAFQDSGGNSVTLQDSTRHVRSQP